MFNMRSIFSFYSIFLLALTALALSQPQNTSDTSAQQQQVQDDAATVLATLQDQIPKDITALQALASNAIFRGNARLASEKSRVISIRGRVLQLAQDLSAALNQTNNPTPAATPVSTPTPNPTVVSGPDTIPSQDPTVGKEYRCTKLLKLLRLFTEMELYARTFVRGAGFFEWARRSVQNDYGCQGHPSDFCQKLENLARELQVNGDSLRDAVKELSAGVNSDPKVRWHEIKSRIRDSAIPVLTAVNATMESIQCPRPLVY